MAKERAGARGCVGTADKKTHLHLAMACDANACWLLVVTPRENGEVQNTTEAKNVTVEVNVVPHGDGGAPDLNGPLHGFKDG